MDRPGRSLRSSSMSRRSLGKPHAIDLHEVYTEIHAYVYELWGRRSFFGVFTVRVFAIIYPDCNSDRPSRRTEICSSMDCMPQDRIRRMPLDKYGLRRCGHSADLVNVCPRRLCFPAPCILMLRIRGQTARMRVVALLHYLLCRSSTVSSPPFGGRTQIFAGSMEVRARS